MRRTLLALCLLASPAIGQTPAPQPAPVPAPTPAPAVVPPSAIIKSNHPEPVLPGVMVTLDAEGSVGDDLGWDTDSDESVYQVDTSKKRLYFASPIPGIYRFKLDAYGIASGKIKVARAKATVTVIDPSPTPSPTPTPTPTPVPVPAPPAPAPARPLLDHLHATLFYDINDTSVVSFRASKGLGTTLKNLGVDWYMLATTSPAAQPYNSELAKDGSPVVVFQDDAGNILKDRSLRSPKSPADLIAAVQAMRGGK